MQLTPYYKIFVLPPVEFDSKKLEEGLERLKEANRQNVRTLLLELVPNFNN